MFKNEEEINCTENFKRNSSLELFLTEINEDLLYAEQKLIKKRKDDYPLIFIIGPHRSGSTLMMQWLANTGQFSYPTNILSRFYKVPIIGAKIQMLLTDEKYNFRNEILDFNSKIDFSSENGKTKGALSPNEFWYFWRQFLPFKELDYLPNKELFEQIDVETFKAELLGVANVFQKPFALKGMICNYNIEFLNKIFDKVIFVYTKRNPLTNIESVLKARERQLGSSSQWYSFKIPEYYELIKIDDPVKQTAGQIYYINKAVEEGLSNVEENRKVIVDYEDFCIAPEKYYYEISKKLNLQGWEITDKYCSPEFFTITREKIKDEKITKAYNEFLSKKEI